MTPDDLQEYASFLADFVSAVQAAKKAGQTVDQVAQSWKIPARYSGYGEPQAARLRSNIETIYKETQ